MVASRICKFYKDSGTLGVGRGIGYCDLDCDQTTCDGDIDFCEKPIVLRTYLFEQVKRGGDLEWERKRNVHFSGSLKAGAGEKESVTAILTVAVRPVKETLNFARGPML